VLSRPGSQAWWWDTAACRWATTKHEIVDVGFVLAVIGDVQTILGGNVPIPADSCLDPHGLTKKAEAHLAR
jgi:hypothetical protein